MRISFRLGALALVMGLFAAGAQAQSGSVTGSMPGAGSPATTAGSGHLERIKASGTLRVCIWPDY